MPHGKSRPTSRRQRPAQARLLREAPGWALFSARRRARLKTRHGPLPGRHPAHAERGAPAPTLQAQRAEESLSRLARARLPHLPAKTSGGEPRSQLAVLPAQQRRKLLPHQGLASVRALAAALVLILLATGSAGAAGTLRVATSADYPPFNYLDEEDRLAGFDIRYRPRALRRDGGPVFIHPAEVGVPDPGAARRRVRCDRRQQFRSPRGAGAS